MAVIDSSALIPLLKIGKINLLKKCFKENLIIPKIVWKEVVEEGKRLGKNTLPLELMKTDLRIVETGKGDILNISGLEEADLEVLSVAYRKNDVLVTSDAALYAAAISQGIRAWWLTTLMLYAVKQKFMKREEAKNTVLELVAAGVYLKPEILSRILMAIDKL